MKYHLIYLPGDVKLLLVTVNNRLIFEIEIVHDLSCRRYIIKPKSETEPLCSEATSPMRIMKWRSEVMSADAERLGCGG